MNRLETIYKSSQIKLPSSIAIGGADTLIPDENTLADHLTITTSSIRNFRVVGDTVLANIINTYEIGETALTFENDTNIRYFDQGIGGISTGFTRYFANSSVFYVTSKTEGRCSSDEMYEGSNLKYAFFENADTLRGYKCFAELENTKIYLGNLQYLDRMGTGNNIPFSGSTNVDVYVPPNAPAIAGTGYNRIEILDTTTPNAVTDLSASEIGGTYIKLDFTEIANADFYEVWQLKNSVWELIGEIISSGDYISGLEENTNNELKIATCDQYWNGSGFFEDVAKQAFSNTINVTTILKSNYTISQNTIGGTYVLLNENYIAPNETKTVEVYVNGVLNNTITNASNGDVYATNLNEQTNYDIYLVIEGNQSNTINVTTTTIDTTALFQNAVAYYKLDETSGDAIDVVNGYNGTLVGGVTQGVAGKIGNAYSFDGSSGYVNTTLNNIGVNSFTVGCWLKSIQTLGISRVLSFRGNGALGNRNGFQISPNFGSNNWSNTAIDDGNGNGILFTAPLNENDGNWHLVILRFDSSTGEANLIIDNTIVETINEPNLIGFNVTGFPLSIAAATESLGQFYQGEIDEIFIQQTKLSLGQISDLYNNGNGVTI